MRTLVDKIPWGPGPWVGEPDWVLWRDEATGLLCLIKRNCEASGTLNGYVEVPPGHPWHQASYDDVEVDVHGGLTFAGHWGVKPEGEDWLCPVEYKTPFFLGFDTARCGDKMPAMLAFLRKDSDWAERFSDLHRGETYKNLAYVQEECRNLALQVHQARRPLWRRIMAIFGGA
jgi:hypothetical protein